MKVNGIFQLKTVIVTATNVTFIITVFLLLEFVEMFVVIAIILNWASRIKVNIGINILIKVETQMETSERL